MRRAMLPAVALLGLAVLAIIPVRAPMLQAEEGPTPLGWTNAEIDQGLMAGEERRQAALAKGPDPTDISGDAGRLAVILGWYYEQGALRAARDLVSRHPELRPFDEQDEVAVGATLQMNGAGALRIRFAREDAARAVVIGVPPGTYGEPISAAGEERSGVQPLALLRPAAVILEAGQKVAEVNIPIACAQFDAECPNQGQPYVLRRFAEGSAEERLMTHLCAGDLKSECEAQMAVWMVRNGMTAAGLAHLQRLHRASTFQSYRPVRPEHAAGAARLMIDAGIDPRGMKYFGGPGSDRSAKDRS